jgi:hypothetical protein
VKRLVHLLVVGGLLLSLVGALCQSLVMLLDLLLPIDLRWYWGGSLAFFLAPVAFALTGRLLSLIPFQDRPNA